MVGNCVRPSDSEGRRSAIRNPNVIVTLSVIPANAGIQGHKRSLLARTPAFAGGDAVFMGR